MDTEVGLQGSGDFVGTDKTGESGWGRAAVGAPRGKSSRTREDNFWGGVQDNEISGEWAHQDGVVMDAGGERRAHRIRLK